MGKEESKTSNLKSEEKVLLHQSIAQYLERCGFSKCFKKLLSEAKIEKKELNSALPDLEEVYLEFLNKRDQVNVEVKDESVDAEDGKKKAENVDEKKDKKKKTKEVAVNEITEANAVEGAEKVKKKKKKETKIEVTEEEEKVKEAEVTEEEKVKEADPETQVGQKDKKKKKKKSKSVEAESGDDDEKENVSKKRKRSEPEEKKEEIEDDEESKRRKKEENVEEDNGSVLETPVKQTEVQENGDVEKSETKSTNKKSGKGLSNSKEPKKPFQRVNADEVVFTDDRLKDNSYWAKDGADSGYGAKAQEVLGQVRGRDFRHEKTKKKRGSYRGGEIDLQSHSVKFEYSDDE
ncbi:hypothetical protein AALP_AA8G358400 [Arabis alpina]|uniref:Srp40 C-terminal domain-containing protein n=1 Tax=Arabis alpina TaxID=50452 RepID=A0A087GBK5_ARAAL|nr:hypothetical protein AALP_AA8G358400 [Arabis alpina]